MSENTSQKIFLSHKGKDKALVRTYHAILKTLGFDAWLDEDAMHAGAVLERALLKGMKDSCAAVFFLTKNYRDDGFLATEIDYAIAEWRDKGDHFSIIVLQMDTGVIVPELLGRFLRKSPQTQFEGLHEIIRALPVKLPRPMWRSPGDAVVSSQSPLSVNLDTGNDTNGEMIVDEILWVYTVNPFTNHWGLLKGHCPKCRIELHFDFTPNIYALERDTGKGTYVCDNQACQKFSKSYSGESNTLLDRARRHIILKEKQR